MLDRCALLISQVLWGNHSEEEWLDLYAQYNAIATTATEEDLIRLEESGIGEILYMICSESESVQKGTEQNTRITKTRIQPNGPGSDLP